MSACRYTKAFRRSCLAGVFAAVLSTLPFQAAAKVHHHELESRVTGTAVSIECRGVELRLHVMVGKKETIFVIHDPHAITVRHAKNGHFDFSCRSMKPLPMTVVFGPVGEKGVAGQVREIEFDSHIEPSS